MEKIIYKKIKELKPYENNPRFNDDAVGRVAESIKQFGFKVPIVCDKDGVIVCGHTRYKAAKSLKIEEVPCIVADDLTEEQIKAFRLADNKVGELAEWDENLLSLELEEIELIDMTDFGFTFFTEDEFGEDFELPTEKPEIESMSFTLHRNQKELIESALEIAGEPSETFGNTNKNGNLLYKVVKEWVGLKKSK